MAGPTVDLDHECEDARQFFNRVESLVTKMSQRLQAAHLAEAARVNARRTEPQAYHAGDWVWVLRPRLGTSDQKVESWWVGPVPVIRRMGEASYEVELRPGTMHMVNAERLKPCVIGNRVELFQFGTTPGDAE